MAQTSRMVAALEALHARLLLRSALSTVDVIDGPPLDWDSMKLATPMRGDGKRYLFVGSSPDDQTGASGEQDFNAAGAVSRDEVFSIVLSSVGVSGDGVIRTARGYADALKAEVEQCIREDPTISDTVLYSRVSTVDKMDQAQNSGGASVTFVFRVACRAYLS